MKNEFKVIKGLVEYSDRGSRPISYKDIKIGLDTSNISKELPFLESIGLASQVSRGKYLPTEECKEFVKELDWNEEDAKRRLANLLSKSWFGQITLKLLKINESTDKDTLIGLLGKENEADPRKHKKALERLVEWMTWAGLLREEDGTLFLALRPERPSEGMREKMKTQEISPPRVESIEFQVHLVISMTPEMTKEKLKELLTIIKEAINEI